MVNDFADYKSKYFSRHYKSAKSTYLRKIASDCKYSFTECREILSDSKSKEDLKMKYYDEEIARISRFCRSAEMDLHRLAET